MLDDRFQQAVRHNATVANAVHAGLGYREIICLLVEQNDSLMARLAELELLVPKRITLADGSSMIWRCPEELIPSDTFTMTDVSDCNWSLKQNRQEAE